MRRLTIDQSPEVIDKIQQEIHRNDDSRYDHRLHGILMVAQGKSCMEVASILGHTPKTLENWVHAFNKEGFEGLKDESRPGRPSSLTEEELQRISQDLRAEPRNIGYQQNFWDGRLLSYHIMEEYKKSIGPRQCQRLFNKLGFRQRKPRPVIASVDPEKKEEFKKTD
jgi:transposase